MKLKSFLLASAVLAGLPGLAAAHERESWYIGVGGGGNWLDGEGTQTITGPAVTTDIELEFDTGWVLLGAVGRSWDGVRLEGEFGYRQNDFETIGFPGAPVTTIYAADGETTQFSQMLNMIFDLPLGETVGLSLGGGLGGVLVDMSMSAVTTPFGDTTVVLEDDDYVFAYQAIAGLNIAVGEHTEIFAEYRYFATDKVQIAGHWDTFGVPFSDASSDIDLTNHSGLIGLRFFFGEEAAPPPPEPPPPSPVTSFNVMFDKKKGAVLNAEEHAKIVEAADALKGGAPSVTIEASGSGTGDPAADEELSQTRGRRVAEELEKLGVPPEKIAVTSQPGGGATVTATQ